VPTASSATFVDSHCHLDDEAFDPDRAAVLERARQAGVATCLVVGVMDGKGGHRRALDVARDLHLPCAAGLHPHEARWLSPETEAELRRLGGAKTIVGLGEIGLDFHYDHSPREDQERAFRAQIRLARELNLPIIIHTRAADDETLRILREERVGPAGGVVHCFSGGETLADGAIELGLHMSFSGIVTFPRAQNLREIARTVPLDRLLVETDAPYLAPVPHRGRRNEPAHVVRVLETIGAERHLPVDELGRVTTENFSRLFGVTVPVTRRAD
jgi:TatD DNase family protein